MKAVSTSEQFLLIVQADLTKESLDIRACIIGISKMP
jgi:hypothetical protein